MTKVKIPKVPKDPKVPKINSAFLAAEKAFNSISAFANVVQDTAVVSNLSVASIGINGAISAPLANTIEDRYSKKTDARKKDLGRIFSIIY